MSTEDNTFSPAAPPPNNTKTPTEVTGTTIDASTEEAAPPSTTAAPGVAIPAEPSTTPLAQLAALLPGIIANTNHREVWGVQLTNPTSSIPTQIVLQKYLNANDGDVNKAKDQLTKTLEWRAKTQPLKLVEIKFNPTKFGGLGYVTVYEDEAEKGCTAPDPEKREIFTWNIYGGVKNVDETFGDVDQFISWRVALMELAMQTLALSTATKPITATYDPYKITQVHDYKGISFMRQSPSVKAASKTTIEVFAQNYPELLKEKFFVNVPAIMGFIYGMIKVFVAEKTRKKFHPMSNGGALAAEFGGSKVVGLGKLLPGVYGGSGRKLSEMGRETLLE